MCASAGVARIRGHSLVKGGCGVVRDCSDREVRHGCVADINDVLILRDEVVGIVMIR